MKTMVSKIIVILVTVSGFSRAMVAANGDDFTIVKKIKSNARVYELHRTTKNGEDAVLWRSDSQLKGQNAQLQGKNGVLSPKPAVLFLSGVSALHEQGGEVSLLVFEGEADAFVFRFPASVTLTSPVRLHNIWRGGDSVGPYTGEIQFKNHGELILMSAESPKENLIRFDALGKITEDFRDPKKDDRGHVGGAASAASEERSNPGATSSNASKPQPEQPPIPKKVAEAELTVSGPRAAPKSSRLWIMISILSFVTSGLLWILLKRRS
jgi:hypothetical protein